jgi:fluoride exporter
MIRLLIIGTGSFFGGIARYLLSRFVQQHIPTTFPYGTFSVNIIGCLLIGMIYGLSDRFDVINAEWRMFLAVGFCGGFTTFSTFSNENLSLLKDGNFLYFMLYAGLSVLLGLAATYGGNLITKSI